MAADGKARVWFLPTDQGYAGDVVVAVDAAWSALARLLGQEPIRDTGSPCQGGDDKYDVIVARSKGSRTSVFGCSRQPAFTVLSDSYTHPVLEATVAHELMHAFEFSFTTRDDCREDHWWYEATAKWAEHFVYPDANVEHPSAAALFDKPETPLWQVANPNSGPGYPAYVLPYFLGQVQSSKIVATIWGSLATQTTLQAINAAAPGKFVRAWPEFADHNWNQPPVDDYRRWDNLTYTARPSDPGGSKQPAGYHYDASLGGAGYKDIALAVDGLPDLAARYLPFKFSDANARWVAIDPGQFLDESGAPDLNAHVHALIKIGGAWTVERWPLLSEAHYFCRDDPAEAIEELVLVYSNSSIEVDGSGAPKHELAVSPDEPAHLALSSMPCAKSITASGSSTQSFDLDGDLNDYADFGAPDMGRGTETSTFPSTAFRRTSSSTPPLTYEAAAPVPVTWQAGIPWQGVFVTARCWATGGGTMPVEADAHVIRVTWDFPEKVKPQLTLGFSGPEPDLELSPRWTHGGYHCPPRAPIPLTGAYVSGQSATATGEIKGTVNNSDDHSSGSTTFSLSPK